MQLQLHPQSELPQNRLFSVPFFHMVYTRATSMGVQLPESTPSRPFSEQLDAISNKISIQRQLLQPQNCENIFIKFLCHLGIPCLHKAGSVSFSAVCIQSKLGNQQNLSLYISQGKIQPTVVSEPAVSEPSVVIYRRLCRMDFEEQVFDSTKDVIVLFKTPWCRRCRKMELALRQTASLLQNKNIRVYQYDVTANDIPDCVQNRLYGFPTIMMWPAAKKAEEPVVYRGKAKLVDMMRFVAEHATTKFPIPDYESLETRLVEDDSAEDL